VINTVSVRSQRKPHGIEIPVRPGSSEKLVGRGGEINASSARDFLETLASLAGQYARGEVMTASDERAYKLTSSDRREALVAAYNDQSGRSWQELGATIGTELYETANREGFMRRFLQRADVVQGGIPRIPVNFKSTYAFQAASPSQIQPTLARNRYLLPPEFYIEAHVWVEEREIFQSTADILEQKLLEAQEAVMVQEDKVWKRLADRISGLANTQLSIVGGLTPQNLGLMRQQILQWNLPTTSLLFSNDVLTDFTTNTAFGAFFDPVTQYEVVQTGYIGRLLGLQLLTDAFRVAQLKVLNQGDIYLLSNPEYHGGYTDRGPVTANEVNASASGHGVPARGWHLWEMMSVVLSNARSVVYASRSA
jgi:hypothetical protein